MSASMWIMVALVGVLLLVVLALGFRLWKMRQGGTPRPSCGTPPQSVVMAGDTA